MAYNEDSSASGHDEPWIQWFCGLKGHEMFCEVERSYIEDGFNLYGLRACVSNFSDCLDLILDRIGPDDSDDSHLTQNACTLYGLIHARYIITAHGLDSMYNKYAAKEFGTCPLLQCSGQPVLPVGLKDEMGAETIKIFCPKCNQVYHPPPVRSRSGSSCGVDGAAFGTTFPHLFLMTFSNLVPDPLPSEFGYVPRVFGFRVHKSSTLRKNALHPRPSTPTSSQPQQQQQIDLPADDDPSRITALTKPPPPSSSAPTGIGKSPLSETTKKDDEEDESGTAEAADPDRAKSTTSDVVADSAVGAILQPVENDEPNEQGSTRQSKPIRGSTKKRTKEEGSSLDREELIVQWQGPGGNNDPTFLVNNSAKRRRRNNGSEK